MGICIIQDPKKPLTNINLLNDEHKNTKSIYHNQSLISTKPITKAPTTITVKNRPILNKIVKRSILNHTHI